MKDTNKGGTIGVLLIIIEGVNEALEGFFTMYLHRLLARFKFFSLH